MNAHIKKIALCVCVILLTAPLLTLAESTSAQQRKQFIDAQRSLRYEKMGQYYALKKQLREEGYILYPYLQYAELKKMINQAPLPTDTVRRFLREQEGTVLEQRTREYWLTQLAKKKKWSIYVQDYKPTDNAALQCYDVYARYVTTKNKKILDEAKNIWLSAYSNPQACDLLFDTWKKENSMNEKLVWERIQLAADANQLKLVQYLKKYIPENEQYLVQAWVNVYRDPRLASSKQQFHAQHPFLRSTQIYGIKRLAHRNVKDAMKHWSKIAHQYTFTEAQKQSVYRAFALELAMDYDKDAREWFKQITENYYDTTLYEWEIRLALRHKQWREVIRLINKLPENMKEDPTWQYWHARALEAIGDRREAKAIYAKLANIRDYHGFMASDKISEPYPLNLPLTPPKPESIKKVSDNKGIKRAIELYQIGRINDARREWEFVTNNMNEDELQAAAQIAHSLDWHDRAIFTLSKADNRNNIDMRFPMAYRPTIEQEAQKQGVNPAWVFAIARRESAFVPDAKSPAGALGLMQVMPYTGKLIAKEINEPYFSRQQLLDLRKNVKLGTAYLNKLYRELDSNIVLATAAYNAGPQRVRQWLPERGQSIDPDIWIETIPFYETREYLKGVLIYRMIYLHHIGKDSDKLTDVLKPIRDF